MTFVPLIRALISLELVLLDYFPFLFFASATAYSFQKAMQHNCPDIPKYQLHFSNAQDCEYYKHRTLVHIKQNSGVQSRSIIGEHSARVLLKECWPHPLRVAGLWVDPTVDEPSAAGAGRAGGCGAGEDGRGGGGPWWNPPTLHPHPRTPPNLYEIGRGCVIPHPRFLSYLSFYIVTCAGESQSGLHVEKWEFCDTSWCRCSAYRLQLYFADLSSMTRGLSHRMIILKVNHN